MSRAAKGSEFERETCKRLSRWWTGDPERDDVFWRSSQSGGRATQRAKFGKSTYGSQGDIAFVDPIGKPLLEMFTIELKRGSSIGFPTDLVDASPTKAQRPFEAAIEQAITAHELAKSVSWLLITRRDRKEAMVFGSYPIFKLLCRDMFTPPCVRFHLKVNWSTGKPMSLRFVGILFETFLEYVTPNEIRNAVKNR